MKTNKKPLIAKRKLGSKAHDVAKKPRKIDHNFKQSSDIGEDRGSVQTRLSGFRRGARGKTKTR
jgi:hypothetical protein